MSMNAGKVLGRGIGFPPRIVNGRMVWSEGEQNVRESIYLILMTEQRERLRLPSFGSGLGQFLFEPNTVSTRHLVADRITKALTRWEPRIVVESVTVEPDEEDLQAAIATVTYTLVATQSHERVRVGIALSA